MLKPAEKDGANGRVAHAQQALLLRRQVRLGAIVDELDQRTRIEGLRKLVASRGQTVEIRLRSDDCHDRLLGMTGDARPDPAEVAAEEQRKQRTEEEEDESL